MPTSMAKSHIDTDPVRNFKFDVRILHPVGGVDGANFARMGFMNMSGLAATTEVIPYREGGNNTTQRKMPGQTTFGDVTLSKGVILGQMQPWDWMKQIFAANAGTGGGGPTTNFRSDISIAIRAHPVTDQTWAPAYVRFRLYNAWITGIAFSELDAGGNAVYVQQLTLAHEGYEMSMAEKIGQNANWPGAS